jgi:hypothetical protein
MLVQIQLQLATNEVITEKKLASELNISCDALSPMLELLCKRGLVEKISSGNCAGGCGCVAAKVLAYRWLGEQNKVTPLNIISV